MKKIAVLIDGGHLRVLAKKAGKAFTVDFIEKLGLSCAKKGEEAIQRILSLRRCPVQRNDLASDFWNEKGLGKHSFRSLASRSRPQGPLWLLTGVFLQHDATPIPATPANGRE